MINSEKIKEDVDLVKDLLSLQEVRQDIEEETCVIM